MKLIKELLAFENFDHWMGKQTGAHPERTGKDRFEDLVEVLDSIDPHELLDNLDDSYGEWFQSHGQPDMTINGRIEGTKGVITIDIDGVDLDDYDVGDRGHHGTEISSDDPAGVQHVFEVELDKIPEFDPDDDDVDPLDILDDAGATHNARVTHTVGDVTDKFNDDEEEDDYDGNDVRCPNCGSTNTEEDEDVDDDDDNFFCHTCGDSFSN